MTASKEDSTSLKLEMDDSLRFRSRASSDSARSDKFAAPMSNDPERCGTPAEFDDDRMSVASSTAAKCSLRNNAASSSSSQKFEGFEKECSYESSPSSHSENKLDLAMVPVISDQLLYDIVNKERTIEQIDVYLFVKKSLDLLSAKNSAETKLEQLKHRNAELELENRSIRESKVKMQVRVEQEEEYISNMLLKRIQKLKTDKELLALKYEQEEEFLTNDLMRKLMQLEGERDELATRLSKDQSWVVNNLLMKIRKLEAEIQNNHKSLEQLRRDKVDLENSLEHEQEALFNKIGKRMDQLEAEKRRLQTRLDEVDGGGGNGAATVAAGGGAASPSTSSVNSSMIVEAPSSSSLSSSAASLRLLSRANSGSTSGYGSAASSNLVGGGVSGVGAAGAMDASTNVAAPASHHCHNNAGMTTIPPLGRGLGMKGTRTTSLSSEMITPASSLDTSMTSSIGGGSLMSGATSGIGGSVASCVGGAGGVEFASGGSGAPPPQGSGDTNTCTTAPHTANSNDDNGASGNNE